MESRGINLSALRRAAPQAPQTVRSTRTEEVEEDYVSPLAAPPAVKASLPSLPVKTPVLPSLPVKTPVLPPPPPMTVKPKANAPKKRGRPAGSKNRRKHGDNGLVLTPTDYHRLHSLMIHGWMTRSHLSYLTGDAPSTEERRIRELIAAGYIDAHRVEGRKYLYLSAKGFKALQAVLKDEDLPFYVQRRNVRPSTHDLKIITVCSAISLGEEAFYGISKKEVDTLNRNKEAYNASAHRQNTVLETMKQEIMARGGASSEAEQSVLDAKLKTYRSQVFDYQTPQRFTPGIITGPKPIITEGQIRESNRVKNKALWEKGTDRSDRNPARGKWAAMTETVLKTAAIPVRQEGDTRPLTEEETNALNASLARPKYAWVFDYMNAHLWTGSRSLNPKSHRPDGVIVLPHVQGSDGRIRGGSVAIEVEENVKTTAETVANMVSLFDHPLFDRAVYYVPDGMGANNIRNRFAAVERELRDAYRPDAGYPLREAIERFFVIVRMDEDYYLSHRSSPRGEWG